MAKFKVGDKVKVVSDGSHNLTEGWVGKIVKIDTATNERFPIVVEFSKEVDVRYRYLGNRHQRFYEERELEIEPFVGIDFRNVKRLKHQHPI